MTTTITRPAVAESRGVRSLDVLRLHFAQRAMLLRTPPSILAVVFVITGIIAFIYFRVGSVPGTDQWIEASRNNPAIIWSFPGFFGWLGVQTVSLTFPLALSLGSTRRAFVAGTVLTHLVLSAYVTVLLLIVLGLELVTDHWFVGLYVTDVNVLGAGNPLILALVAFLGTLSVLSVGGALAAAWVRHGPIGPSAVAAGTVLTLGIIAIVVIPVATFEAWWLLVTGLVLVALSLAAQYLFLRGSSVR